MKEILLVGSGPSARDVRVPAGAKVACVNDSWKLVDRVPDYYLVAEIPAATVYQGIAATVLANGGRVFMRPAALQQLTINHCGAIETIGMDFGPPELRELHRARPLPATSRGPRPNAPWITSGILMMWVLAELERPARLSMVGLDGYPAAKEIPNERVKTQGAGEIDGEYAPGITPLASRPFRTPEWTQATNELCAAGMKAVSRHYTQTEFVLLSRPHYYRESMRVIVKEN